MSDERSSRELSARTALTYADRAVPHLLAGVYYQTLWATRRWLDLGPNEVLFIEGDEDIVQCLFRDDELVWLTQEQVKFLSEKPHCAKEVRL